MDKKQGTFREQIQFYLIDCKTPTRKVIDISILLLNLLLVALFIIETYPISDSAMSTLWTVEVIVVFFLIIEYFARLYGARNRLKHIYNIYSIIDLVAILPTILVMIVPTATLSLGFIRIIRVLRVFRIFRFLRFTADPQFFFGSITMHVLKVVRLIITILMIFFVSAGLFWLVESPINAGIENYGDAFYFTVVALTTVGFGDIIPISDTGRAVVVLMIISGIILIPWQASLVVREWMHLSTQKLVVCKKCGLRYHDKDASHCKSCGHVIYQEFDG